MSPRVASQPCRSYGEFVPLAEVPLHLNGGWKLLDDLGGDPMGSEFALLAPPAGEEAA